jgi:hypothetical protein
MFGIHKPLRSQKVQKNRNKFLLYNSASSLDKPIVCGCPATILHAAYAFFSFGKYPKNVLQMYSQLTGNFQAF